MKNQRMGASYLKLVFISSNWDCNTFDNIVSMFKIFFQKLAGLWLAGEVANHVRIYVPKVAEGLSAFEQRSCWVHRMMYNPTVLVMLYGIKLWLYMRERESLVGSLLGDATSQWIKIATTQPLALNCFLLADTSLQQPTLCKIHNRVPLGYDIPYSNTCSLVSVW